MNVRKWILIASLVIGMLAAVPGNALATDGHQSHQGACSRYTSSIPKMVEDLKYHGVLSEYAPHFGIDGTNGSIRKQMEEKFAVGEIAHPVVTQNFGCEGTEGAMFEAENRLLEKLEKVVAMPPAFLGKEVCKHPHAKGCKRYKRPVVVEAVIPISCGNLNLKIHVRIEVWFWVRKHKHHPHHPHHHHHHHHHGCGCKTPKTPPKETPPTENCNNNTNNGIGSAGCGNVNECVGIDVCNEEGEKPCECQKGKVTVSNEYEFQELYTDDPPTHFHVDVSAPKGDEITVFFEAHRGSFVPQTIPVKSFGGAQTQFESVYHQPSEPGCYRVWVKVVDYTLNEEVETPGQCVEVLSPEGNP